MTIKYLIPYGNVWFYTKLYVAHILKCYRVQGGRLSDFRVEGLGGDSKVLVSVQGSRTLAYVINYVAGTRGSRILV